MDRFVSVARIVRTRGVQGEVCAVLLTDFPERFSSLHRVRILSTASQSWEELENFWIQRERIVLKFRGRNRLQDVQSLVGSDVQIFQQQLVKPPKDTFYHFDLIGCRVVEDQETLGKVVGIFETGSAGANLVVETGAEKEFMVPLVREFVRDVSVDKKLIRVKLPSGLVDLTADESKRKRDKQRHERRNRGNWRRKKDEEDQVRKQQEDPVKLTRSVLGSLSGLPGSV